MIITVLLTMLVVWCLFYTVIPNGLLIVLCLILGIFLGALSKHKHEGILEIDQIAQQSKLNRVNPIVKFYSVLILMFICVGSKSPIIGIILIIWMMFLTVSIGKVSLHKYFSILLLPLSFILVSGLALLWDYNVQPIGIIHIPLFHGYLFINHMAQKRALLVLSKAMGALSCLYLLSLSTPMSDIIAVLRKSRVPGIIIELMYLIYRYIFVLFQMHRLMRDSAKSRLGFIDFTRSVQTTGKIYSNLLGRSYHKAMINFDAMESRCYDGEIRFIENEKNISFLHMVLSVLTILVVLGLAIILH